MRRRRRPGATAAGVFAVGLTGGLLLSAWLIPSQQGATSAGLSAGGPAAGGDRAATPGAGIADEGRGDGGREGAAASGSAGGAGARRRTQADPAATSAGRSATGVDDGSIKIGIGVPDLGPLANLGPNFDFGDPQKHFEAILAGWRASGQVPVHGRTIEFVYRRYSMLSADEQRAACTGWAKDDHVFAVIALQYFFATECLPREQHIPLIVSDGLAPARMQSSAPYLFSLHADTGRIGRNWMHWAHRRGLLKGRRIGLYYATGDPDGMVGPLKTALAGLGYTVAEEATTDNSVTGGPQDNVAVQRFQLAGVNLAILAVSSLAQTNFMQSAEGQGYRPTYIATDFFSSTADTATGTFPPNQFDKTFAMTGYRFGEVAAGIPLNGPSRECIDRYARYSKQRVEPRSRPAEWFILEQGCDDAAVLLQALRNAGPNLDRAAFIRGIEQIKGMEMGVHADVSFGPDDHTGVDSQRTMQWHRDCSCYRATGVFEPYFVR